MFNARQHRLLAVLAVVALGLTACESGGDDDSSDSGSGSEGSGTGSEDGSTNEGGETVKIAFSAPGADHGWLAAITENAEAEAANYDDVDFVLLEGTNGSAAQVSQVEQLMAEDPDVLIILPHEGGPLTPVAQEAVEEGNTGVHLARDLHTAMGYPRMARSSPGAAATTTASACRPRTSPPSSPTARATWSRSRVWPASRSPRSARRGSPTPSPSCVVTASRSSLTSRLTSSRKRGSRAWRPSSKRSRTSTRSTPMTTTWPWAWCRPSRTPDARTR